MVQLDRPGEAAAFRADPDAALRAQSEPLLLDELSVQRDPRGNAAAPLYATSADGVFAAGDARRGQSLIVWAINEGRQCARAVERWLAATPARS